MKNQTVSGTKKPLFGGRRPLFTQKELLLLTGPLLVEQLLEVTVGMADTMMVSRCGEAAISGVSLVDMINNLIIVLFAALPFFWNVHPVVLWSGQDFLDNYLRIFRLLRALSRKEHCSQWRNASSVCCSRARCT